MSKNSLSSRWLDINNIIFRKTLPGQNFFISDIRYINNFINTKPFETFSKPGLLQIEDDEVDEESYLVPSLLTEPLSIDDIARPYDLVRQISIEKYCNT